MLARYTEPLSRLTQSDLLLTIDPASDFVLTCYHKTCDPRARLVLIYQLKHVHINIVEYLNFYKYEHHDNGDL